MSTSVVKQKVSPESAGRPPFSTRLIRFCASGVVATLIHLLVVTIAVYGLGVGVTKANITAFLIANCFTYLANALWSFEAGVSGRNYGKFLTVSALQLAIAAGLSMLCEKMGLPPIYSIVAVMVAIPAIAFVMHSLWTFK